MPAHLPAEKMGMPLSHKQTFHSSKYYSTSDSRQRQISEESWVCRTKDSRIRGDGHRSFHCKAAAVELDPLQLVHHSGRQVAGAATGAGYDGYVLNYEL
jgi:hypothetical protein